MKNIILYHYTTVEGLKGIIENKNLRATRIEFLNDSSEKKYIHDLINEIRNSDKEFKDIYDTLNSDFISLLEPPMSALFDRLLGKDGKLYVISLCKQQDLLPMWNLYSRGNGYSIGINIDTFTDMITNSSAKINLYEILYDKDEQLKKIKQDMKKMFSHKISDYKKRSGSFLNGADEEGDDFIIYTLKDFFNLHFQYYNYFKHPCFSNECETRISIELVDNKDFPAKYRTTAGGMFIEYIELPFEISNEYLFADITLHPCLTDIHKSGIDCFLQTHNLEYVPTSISSLPFRNL